MEPMVAKRTQNGAKRAPKSMQNHFKIDAKIDAEKASKNDAKIDQKWCQNDPTNNQKSDFFSEW